MTPRRHLAAALITCLVLVGCKDTTPGTPPGGDLADAQEDTVGEGLFHATDDVTKDGTDDGTDAEGPDTEADVGPCTDEDDDGVCDDLEVDCGLGDPNVAPGLAESCDGVDNDCDGDTDEGFLFNALPPGSLCDGVGTCGVGVVECTSDGLLATCSTNPEGSSSEAVAELCDQKDNDCDGLADEDFGIGDSCDGPDADECANGTWTCKADETGAECANETVQDVVEVCNDVDDDCDGATDEDFIGKGEACDGADTDACKNGVFVCTGDESGLECGTESATNIAESCDGVDNDCDGWTDENDPAEPCGDSGIGCACGFTCTAAGTCTDGKVGEGMAYVGPGNFWMGCKAEAGVGCSAGSAPLHEVVLSPYMIDLTEVTVAEYGECVSAGACPSPCVDDAITCGNQLVHKCNWGRAGAENHPINCMTWFDASSYCGWAGKRLPTEAEWEKAARGGCELYPGDECNTAMPLHPWGNAEATCGYASMCNGDCSPPGDGYGCSTGYTSGVASYPAGKSPYGLWDMGGNVFEFVSDWWADDYYPVSPLLDPQGPDTWGEDAAYPVRVLKGGSLANSGAGLLKVSYRYPMATDQGMAMAGFRCAASVTLTASAP